LKKDTDYTVSYKNNTNAGTGKVVITGKGNYTGSVTKTFKIDKATQKISVEKDSYTKTYGCKTFKLNAKCNIGNISYKVNDTSVVKVNNKGQVSVKGIGETTISIIGTSNGNVKGSTKKIKIVVNPKIIDKSKVNLINKKGKTVLKINSKEKNIGYVVEISTNNKFKNNTKYTTNQKQLTIKNIKSNKKYYARIRTYKNYKNKKYYSEWVSFSFKGI
jgi:hypothetical protein